VQSCPEPGLAILAVGRRDLSYDLELPIPLSSVNAAGAALAAPADWKITALNDQHAYLRGEGPACGAQGRRPGGAGHLASLHHLRQMALDAGCR
jgi:D-serine dehydratase